MSPSIAPKGGQKATLRQGCELLLTSVIDCTFVHREYEERVHEHPIEELLEWEPEVADFYPADVLPREGPLTEGERDKLVDKEEYKEECGGLDEFRYKLWRFRKNVSDREQH